ncbi:MAG: WD40/YVTN/BNR-like repeat-containing protein [Flavipsychrobacter sp.]
MNNRTLFYKLGMVVILASALQGCKPTILPDDNNEIISKPYSMYVALQSGMIYNTNDGYSYKNVKGPDDVPVIGMVASGNNLIYGQNSVHTIKFGVGATPNTALVQRDRPSDGNTMFLNWPKYNRLYFAGSTFAGNDPMCYSNSHGDNDSLWFPDNAFVEGVDVASVKITSFTMLNDGFAVAFDEASKTVYLTDNPVSSRWSPGTPISSSSPSLHYFVSHLANTILVIADTSDIFYSANHGGSWQQFTGIPAGTANLCAVAPFDQCILVGTNHGIYRLTVGQTKFVAANAGLPSNAIVRSLVAKYDFYKSGTSANYVYAATDKGLYKSFDNGDNWTKVSDWNFSTLY